MHYLQLVDALGESRSLPVLAWPSSSGVALEVDRTPYNRQAFWVGDGVADLGAYTLTIRTKLFSSTPELAINDLWRFCDRAKELRWKNYSRALLGVRVGERVPLSTSSQTWYVTLHLDCEYDYWLDELGNVVRF